MKAMTVVLLAVLLISVGVVTLRRSRPPSPPPLHPEIAPKVPAPSSAPLSALRSTIQTAPTRTRRPFSPHGPVDISGPLRDRGWVRRVIPSYPEWAEEEGLAGTVSVKIWVDPHGKVRSFMQMQRISPSPRLDDVALEALRQWRFGSIPNAVGDQWGVVTFRFTL